MRKLLSVFLAGCLLLLLPATIWASAETTYESEQGQAMIKAPSSASPNASANTEADVDSSDDSEGTLSPSGSSSGMDWSAANTASTPSSASRQFTVCIDPGHQGSWVDMSAQEPMAPGSSQTKIKLRPVLPVTTPRFRNMKSTLKFLLSLKKNWHLAGTRLS